jgi:hypothetical protein
MDDRDTHEDDEFENTDEDDSQDTVNDDDSDTGQNTDKDDSDKADEAKERQKMAWLKKIESGDKTLDDMPKNLEWLKKDIQDDMKKKPKDDDIDSRIQKVLTEREAKLEFDYLVDDLKEADISAEQEAQLREEYEDLLSTYSRPTDSQKVKALLVARRLIGLQDTTSLIRERRRKGMTLPSLSGTRKRSTVNPEKMTEIEKKLSGGLPPEFQ